MSLLEQPILRHLARSSHRDCTGGKVTVLSRRIFCRGCSLSSFFCQPLVDVCLVSAASSGAVCIWATNSGARAERFQECRAARRRVRRPSRGGAPAGRRARAGQVGEVLQPLARPSLYRALPSRTAVGTVLKAPR